VSTPGGDCAALTRGPTGVQRESGIAEAQSLRNMNRALLDLQTREKNRAETKYFGRDLCCFMFVRKLKIAVSIGWFSPVSSQAGIRLMTQRQSPIHRCESFCGPSGKHAAYVCCGRHDKASSAQSRPCVAPWQQWRTNCACMWQFSENGR
jgi:hypothetical protein